MKNKAHALQTSQPIQTKAKAQAKQANLLSPSLAPPISDDHTHEQQIMGKSCASPSGPLYFLFCTTKNTKEAKQEQQRQGKALPFPPKEGLPPRRPIPSLTLKPSPLCTHTHTNATRHNPPKRATTTQAT